jgi:alkylated DNA repair dioxygenase AlkB
MGTDSLFPDDIIAPALPPGSHYTPGFLPGVEQQRLVEEIDASEWSLELKRRVQHYGYRYDYQARTVDQSVYLGALPAFVAPVVGALGHAPMFSQTPDQMIVNEYLPGQGIAAHVDCESCFNDRIAIVSLGWPYEMEFQHTRSEARAVLLLGAGSLLILAGEVRYQWTHRIRARLRDRGIPRKRRLSLTFRKVLLSR